MVHHLQMPINTVLVIDDHPVVADSVAALVRSINEEVRIEICHSLRAAQAYLLKGMLPSLIVTDLSLPDSKGIGTVEQIVGQIRAAAGPQIKLQLVVFSGIEHALLKNQCVALERAGEAVGDVHRRRERHASPSGWKTPPLHNPGGSAPSASASSASS